MSYTPTNWETGDIISAEKLNKLENGVASGSVSGTYVVNAVTDPDTQIVTLDKTFREIKTAFLAGKSVFIYYTKIAYDGLTPYEIYSKDLVLEIGEGDGTVGVRPWIGLYTSGQAPFEYYADSLDAYPYYDPND